MNNVGPQTIEPLVQRTGPAAGLLLKNAELLDPFSDLTGRHDLPPRFSVVRAMTFTTAPGLYLAATSD